MIGKQDNERILSALSRIEARQVVLTTQVVIIQAQIEELKDSVENNSQKTKDFGQRVKEIQHEVEKMVRMTDSSLGQTDSVDEALSKQTRLLAKQNEKDNMQDAKNVNAPESKIDSKVVEEAESMISALRALQDKEKSGSKGSSRDRQIGKQQQQSKSTPAHLFR